MNGAHAGARAGGERLIELAARSSLTLSFQQKTNAIAAKTKVNIQLLQPISKKIRKKL